MQITSKVWNTNQFAAHLLSYLMHTPPQANPKVRWIFWAIGAKASERNLQKKKKKETKFQMPEPDNNSAK